MLGYYLLKAICRKRKPPSVERGGMSGQPEMPDFNAKLSQLDRSFPNFTDMIRDKVVLDYGCGFGFQTIGMALRGAKHVIGVEITAKEREYASNIAEKVGIGDRVSFVQAYDMHTMKGSCDLVLTHNSMEHFDDPLKRLGEMKHALNKNGTIISTFGPPWLSPYGAHTQYMTSFPWIQIVFAEKTVMAVRSIYKKDGAEFYEQVNGGLNRLTVKKFEEIVDDAGLMITYRKDTCFMGLNRIVGGSFLREYLTYDVSVLLRVKSSLDDRI